jgi:hypothetical protein
MARGWDESKAEAGGVNDDHAFILALPVLDAYPS